VPPTRKMFPLRDDQPPNLFAAACETWRPDMHSLARDFLTARALVADSIDKYDDAQQTPAELYLYRRRRGTFGTLGFVTYTSGFFFRQGPSGRPSVQIPSGNCWDEFRPRARPPLAGPSAALSAGANELATSITTFHRYGAGNGLEREARFARRHTRAAAGVFRGGDLSRGLTVVRWWLAGSTAPFLSPCPFQPRRAARPDRFYDRFSHAKDGQRTRQASRPSLLLPPPSAPPPQTAPAMTLA
jgi:hypothetical protein